MSGKEVILIPQETTLGYQYIVLDVGGKIYTSPLPSSLQLQSGKQSELAISFIPTEDVLISKVEGEINSWKYRAVRVRSFPQLCGCVKIGI